MDLRRLGLRKKGGKVTENRAVMKILCFGDSNTWGYLPSLETEDQRYPPEVRWTSLLQRLLGPSYVVVEAGLNSRTTDLDDPEALGKNGLKALPGVLKKNAPLDLIVLLLGTNDLKAKYDRSAERVAQGVDNLVQCIFENFSPENRPRLLILSPPIPKLLRVYDSFRYDGLEAKAQSLAHRYELLAKKRGAAFINLAKFISSSDIDGVHLDPTQHHLLATTLHPVVVSLVKGTG